MKRRAIKLLAKSPYLELDSNILDTLKLYYDTFKAKYTKEERAQFYTNIKHAIEIYCVFRDMFELTFTLDTLGNLVIKFPDDHFHLELWASGSWWIFCVTDNKPSGSLFCSRLNMVADLKSVATRMSDVYPDFSSEQFLYRFKTCYCIITV